jgi:hypothetical protein
MDVPVYMNKIVGSNKSLAVSVGVGPVKPGMDINTWIDGVTKGLPAGTVDKSVDPQTNSGVVVVVGSDGLTNVKKYFIIGNQLYAVGTNRFDDAAVSEQDKNEATDIINSFRLLRK